MRALAGLLFVAFLANDTHGLEYELELFADVNPTGNSSPLDFTPASDGLYFIAEGPEGREVYRTDGVDGSDLTLFNVNPSTHSDPSLLTPYRDTVFFRATGNNGREAFKIENDILTDFNIHLFLSLIHI